MRDTVKAISRLYLLIAIWFVVMVVTSLGLLGPMSMIFSAIGESPVNQALFTLGIAVSTATMVTGLAWMRLRARPQPEARGTATDFKDVAPASSLVATRSSFRP